VNAPKEVELDGRRYSWDGKGWYDTKSYERPPDSLVHKLNRKIEAHLEAQDEHTKNPWVLLDRAKGARESKQLARTERLVRRALAVSPGHTNAAAMLCALLREQRRPREALRDTEGYTQMGKALIQRS
jgi:hypothetical protein